MAEWLASPDWDREAEKSWVRIPVSLSGILSRGNLRVIVSRSSTPVTSNAMSYSPAEAC